MAFPKNLDPEEIYEGLPGNNSCNACGEQNCWNFALAVSNNSCNWQLCPHMAPETRTLLAQTLSDKESRSDDD